MKRLLFFVHLLLVAIAGIALLFVALPEACTWLMREDGLVENLSALFFFGTFVASIYLWFSRRAHTRWIWFAGGVGLLGFLDEISFGERLFNLRMPAWDDVKFDAAHDILFWLLRVKLETDWRERHGAILFALLAGMALAGWVGWRARTWLHARGVRAMPGWRLAVATLICLAVAALVDLDYVENAFLYAIEEVLECLAGVALLLAALEMGASAKPDRLESHGARQAVLDAGAIFYAGLVSIWLRFKSGLIPLFHHSPPLGPYVVAAMAVTLVTTLILLWSGHFLPPHPAQVPLAGIAGVITIAFIARICLPTPPSRIVVLIALIAVPAALILGRSITCRCRRSGGGHTRPFACPE